LPEIGIINAHILVGEPASTSPGYAAGMVDHGGVNGCDARARQIVMP